MRPGTGRSPASPAAAAPKEAPTSCGLSHTANPTRPVVCSKTKHDSCCLKFGTSTTLRKSKTTNPRLKLAPNQLPSSQCRSFGLLPAPEGRAGRASQSTAAPEPATTGGRAVGGPPHSLNSTSDLGPPHLLQQARHDSASPPRTRSSLGRPSRPAQSTTEAAARSLRRQPGSSPQDLQGSGAAPPIPKGKSTHAQ